LSRQVHLFYKGVSFYVSEPSNQLFNPRYVELYQKKKREGLTPEEEGEMRGLFAYPDNPEAAELVKREYLASQGVGEMSEADRESLRAIRARKFAQHHRNVANIDLSEIPSNPSEPEQAEISATELAVFHARAQLPR
jgi:hypothetical protein